MCCCLPVRDLEQSLRKSVIIQWTSLCLLSLSIAMLYQSTVQNSPWFRLAVQKHSNRNLYQLHTPLALSFVGVSSDGLLNHEMYNRIVSTDRVDLTRNLSHSDNTSNIFTDNNFLYRNRLSNGSKNVERPLRNAIENQWAEFVVENSDDGAPTVPSFDDKQNDSDVFISALWSLKSVELTIPSFHVKSRVLKLEELSGDPIITAALSLSGFYEAVIDAKSATELILTFGMWSMISTAIAITVVMLWIFASLFARISFRRRSNRHGLLFDYEEPSTYRNVSPSNNITSCVTRIPSTLPFLLIGSSSLVAAVICAIGFIVWLTRSLVDANHIMVGIATLVGENVVQWLTKHSAFEIEIGLIEYLVGLASLVLISLVNLCADFRIKRENQQSPQLEYQPPIDIVQLNRLNDNIEGGLRGRTAIQNHGEEADENRSRSTTATTTTTVFV